MEQSSTPPRRTTRANPVTSPQTPEITRRIEESRLKAKALRERSIAAEKAAALSSSSTLKRPHTSISTTDTIPSTVRDARSAAAAPAIEPARKFKKYVDHDFSKMTDTKGGFLTAEDDPWNKALHAPAEGDAAGGKPAHMTLKEWERHQLLKELQRTKQGPFEPGLSVLGKEGNKCRECGSMEIDFVWAEVFRCCVCSGCKEKWPEKYSLLTKTEAKDDYLLTDPELKDPELLPHLSKPNPHKSHWHDMMLFLRYQVEEYAFTTKWGSAAALDAEFAKREAEKKARKEKKFKEKLKELKKKTRTDAYRRGLANGGKSGGGFGDAVGQGKHEHDWGIAVEREGVSIKTCTGCGMELEEIVF